MRSSESRVNKGYDRISHWVMEFVLEDLEA